MNWGATIVGHIAPWGLPSAALSPTPEPAARAQVLCFVCFFLVRGAG